MREGAGGGASRASASKSTWKADAGRLPTAGTDARSVCAPSVPPSVQFALARPLLSVVEEVGSTDPPPVNTLQVTATPLMVLVAPLASSSSTYSTVTGASRAPIVSRCAFPLTIRSVRLAAVAVNVTSKTDVGPVPKDGVAAFTVCCPGFGPSVHSVRARPLRSVIDVACVSEPPPVSTVQTIAAAIAGVSVLGVSVFVTYSTSKGCVSRAPTSDAWLLLAPMIRSTRYGGVVAVA